MTRSSWLLFGGLSVVWGLPYFFIKIALHDLAPEWIAFSRLALGALILVPLVRRSDWRPVVKHVPAIAAIALTDMALPFYCIANGERFVTSSVTGMLLSTMPIVVAVLALVLEPRERLARPQVVGLAIGFLGVSALLGFNVRHDRAGLLGVALIAGATVSYSFGVLMFKRWLSELPMLATTAAMLAVAAALLAPTAVLHPLGHLPGRAAIAAVLALGAICTAGAYVMYFSLIARAGVTRAAVVTYLNPAVAAVLGVAFLGESMSVIASAGLLLVIAGSWLSTGGKPPRGLGATISAWRTKRGGAPA